MQADRFGRERVNETKGWHSMDKAVLERLITEQTNFYKKQSELLGELVSTGAAESDVYEDALHKLRNSSKMMKEWRSLFATRGDKAVRVIADTIAGAVASASLPAVTLDEVKAAVGRAGAGAFNPQIFDDFAGYSKGPGPAGGGEVFKYWDKVSESGHYRVQKITQSDSTFVDPKEQSAKGACYSINVHSGELGLVALHSTPDNEGKKQTVLFNLYPLGSARILWIGQTVDDQLRPVSKNVYTVALNSRTVVRGQRAFVLLLFQICMDEKGVASLLFALPPVAFIAVSPPYLELEKRILHFNGLFNDWRKEFRDNSGWLADGIAGEFKKERNDTTRRVFPEAPLSDSELRHAFTDPAQQYDFQLSDLNQFAGKWKANIYAFQPGGTPPKPFDQYLTWLEFRQNETGFYQRVVGASSFEDPLTLTGSECGLQSIVLDAYLPECGLVSWLSGYGPDPSQAESAVLAYKLAGGRTLWVAQFYSKDAVESKMNPTRSSPPARGVPKKSSTPAEGTPGATQQGTPVQPLSVHQPDMKDPKQFNLTLEWIVEVEKTKHRYLVSKTFDIDFTNKKLSSDPFIKVESSSVV
jgi:hypothetical protein